MKFNSTVFFMIITAGIVTISCSKEPAPIETKDEEPPVLETFVNGKILSKKADLCLLGRDSAMHPILKLSAGSDVFILEINGKEDTIIIPDPESSANIQSTENTLDKAVAGTEYVHVVHENIDFWIDKSVYALNCENAVAIEKTFLYSDSSLSNKISSSQNPLRFASIIAKSTEENSSENPEAIKVFYYDLTKKSVQEAYVPSSSISSRIDDIVVSQIVESLKVTKRAVPRNELFSKAAKYKPCKKVLLALNSQKEEQITNSYQEVLKSMQKMSMGVNVEELMTVDQSKDPFK